jgi:hypothetical protein
MSRKCFLVWGILIVPQIFAVWITHETRSRPAPATIDVDLIGLSREINREWRRYDEIYGVPTWEVRELANDGLLQRESLMMQLQTMERNMVERGVEMEIVEDLEAFFATLSGNENLIAINSYIQSLLEWVSPHAGVETECSLERLALHPGVESVLPGISFELRGSPVEMGRRIQESSQGGLLWELREMDMVSLEESGEWWMRGNCSYPDQQDL